MATVTKTALVIGATGGIGGEAAAALLKRGWTVRGLNREPGGRSEALPGRGRGSRGFAATR